jgi:hypothetical protein
MPARKRTPEEQWKALEAQAHEDEMDRILALSEADLDRELADAGLDPAAVGDDAAALAERMLRRREGQEWQAEAARKLARVQARFDAKAGAPRERLPRPELLARIERARAAGAAHGGRVSVMFRNRKPEEASDDELAELLEEIEALGDLDE